MAKYHINPATGNPGECVAQEGNCLYGAATEHYGSAIEARRAFEESMAVASLPAKKKRQLHPDTFLSILTQNEQVLTEVFAPELGNELLPGDYVAFYHDSQSGKDRYVKLSVSRDGSTDYERISGFKSLPSPAPDEVKDAVVELKRAVEELENESDPFTSRRLERDRVTMLETTKGISRVLAKFDWTDNMDAHKGLSELEQIEWSIDHDLQLAEEEELRFEAGALRATKAIVSKCINDARSFKELRSA